jgi:toxin ParE1/3/4
MQNRTIEFHPEALEEAEAARGWYSERSLVASRAFVSEMIHSVETVSQDPEMWPVFEKVTHRYVFQRFPFSLIYRLIEDKIQVVAIAHSKRKPGYWRER